MPHLKTSGKSRESISKRDAQNREIRGLQRRMVIVTGEGNYRICSRCKEVKDLSHFYTNPQQVYGYHNICLSCCSLYASERYRKKYPEDKRRKRLVSKRSWQRSYAFRTKFGITVEDYKRMEQEQNGACAICCRGPEGEDTYRHGKSLAVDHNHDTGEIRGLLCDLCNRGAGQFKDNSQLLQKAAHFMHPTFRMNAFQIVAHGANPDNWL